MASQKPIRRSLLVGCTVFISFLCLVLSIQSYLMVSAALYQRYNGRLKDILVYVENHLDLEDLQECIRTGVPSQAYAWTQDLLNGMVDDFELMYLYICIPLEDEAGTMLNVVSATSAAERARGEEDLPLLFSDSESYSPQELRSYLDAWDLAPQLTYFENKSDYGYCYTACKPLVTADGETIALCCADLTIEELHDSVRNYVLSSVVLTVSIGVLFGLLLLMWMRRDVTGPVEALEASTRYFAAKSHGQKDPGLLVFDAPDIHTKNELESLSRAITQMTRDMKAYVEDILAAERRVKSAELEAEGMSKLAFQDSLTRMKSKAAYNLKLAALEQDIATGQGEFAIVMIDLNNLKKVNDTYGHENGNQYIIGACDIIGDVYRHSPVYRVGGDEFVAVLQGRDYAAREELFRQLEEHFARSAEDEAREPWQRYSAAAGMAEYEPGRDDSVDKVFRRADRQMYENKKQMKACRE